MGEYKVAISDGPECPNCGLDTFDDWWNAGRIKTGHPPVALTGSLRCHGCGRFFHISKYGDGVVHSSMGGRG